MSNLESADLLELVERYDYLIKLYIPLASELAPKLERFGKYRQELQVISAEFIRRGYKPEEPESLKKMVEAAIEKRNGTTQTDTNKGSPESRENPQ